jgi:hypothetical protein
LKFCAKDFYGGLQVKIGKKNILRSCLKMAGCFQYPTERRDASPL